MSQILFFNSFCHNVKFLTFLQSVTVNIKQPEGAAIVKQVCNNHLMKVPGYFSVVFNFNIQFLLALHTSAFKCACFNFY